MLGAAGFGSLNHDHIESVIPVKAGWTTPAHWIVTMTSGDKILVERTYDANEAINRWTRRQTLKNHRG